MLKNQCISVTALRTKTKKYLEELKQEEKYIFVNNKPVAVLIDIDQYEALFPSPTLEEFPQEEVTAEIIKLSAQAKKLKRSKLMNL